MLGKYFAVGKRSRKREVPQLRPPGDSSVQTIPAFTGASTTHLNTGHLIWLPDAVTYDGATWNYEDQIDYPVIEVHPGQGATPTSMASNTLPTFKTAIGNGQLPPCIILYLNTTDPGDSIEGWGMDAADGSYPLESMITLDVPTHLAKSTRAGWGASNRAVCGFSKGGFETLRLRAKYGASHASAYVVSGAPRLDCDLGGAAARYNDWSAGEKAKIFGSDSAFCQSQCPFSSTAGTGLFNVLGANAGGLGSAPLLMLESDPGDTTATSSMNNAINTRLGAAGVSFTTVNLDNASFTPTHNPSQYWAAWVAEATNNLSWIRTNAGWVMP